MTNPGKLTGPAKNRNYGNIISAPFNLVSKVAESGLF